jgi:hypothetical protein
MILFRNWKLQSVIVVWIAEDVNHIVGILYAYISSTGKGLSKREKNNFS